MTAVRMLDVPRPLLLSSLIPNCHRGSWLSVVGASLGDSVIPVISRGAELPSNPIIQSLSDSFFLHNPCGKVPGKRGSLYKFLLTTLPWSDLILLRVFLTSDAFPKSSKFPKFLQCSQFVAHEGVTIVAQ